MRFDRFTEIHTRIKFNAVSTRNVILIVTVPYANHWYNGTTAKRNAIAHVAPLISLSVLSRVFA